jgi:hypothetical protein
MMDSDEEWGGATQKPDWASSGEEEEAAPSLQTISNVQVHVLYNTGSQRFRDRFDLELGTHAIGRHKRRKVAIKDSSVSSLHAEITVGLNAITLVHLSETSRTVIRTRTGGIPLGIHTPFTLQASSADGNQKETQRFDVGNCTCYVTFDEVTPGGALSPAGSERLSERFSAQLEHGTASHDEPGRDSYPHQQPARVTSGQTSPADTIPVPMGNTSPKEVCATQLF